MAQVSKQMEQDAIRTRLKEVKRNQKKLLSGPKKEIPEEDLNYMAPVAPPPPLFELIKRQQTPRILNKVDPEKDKVLIIEFTEFAKSLTECVGLAANQLSYKGKRLNKRFFVLTDGKDWYPILNPKVIKKHGQTVQRIEGCKTWPDEAIVAQRYLKVDIEYQDHTGANLKTQFEGYGAQIIQHEMDHLNGVEEVFTNNMVNQSVGRNEPCPCSSGKKYKKCCIKLEN